MYTTFITSLFLIIILAEEIIILAIDGMMKDAKLNHYFTFQKIIRTLVLVEFTVFNFLFSFANPEYVFQLVFQIVANIAALFYFLLDYFYFSQRTRSYVLWMQGIVFNEIPLKKVFKVLDAKGIEYKERKKVPQQEFSLVEAGKDRGLCIFVPSKDGGKLLKPINPIDENTLMFYAQKIEIDLEKEESLRFYKGNLPSEAIKEYDHGTDSKIYLWFRDKLFSEKGRLILTFVFIGILFVFVMALVIFDQVFHFDIINEWFTKKI